MSYEELNRDQILALKQNYFQGNVSYNELAEADNLVSDEEYKNVNFVEEDF